LIVSKLLFTFVRHISHRCMFERIYMCGFFFLKSLIRVWILKINDYLCARIRKQIKLVRWREIGAPIQVQVLSWL
jgi:hypothetical protein